MGCQSGTWANAPGDGRRQGSFLLLSSPPASSSPHAHAISTPAQPTWTACPIPATKIEGPTHTLASDILWYLTPGLSALARYSSAPVSGM